MLFVVAETYEDEEEHENLQFQAILQLYSRHHILFRNPYIAEPIEPRDVQINDISDEDCWTGLRFRKEHLHDLMIALRIADFDGVLDNRCRVSPEKAFLFTLHRLHCPGNLVDMQHYWGREYTQLSRIFKAMIDFIHHEHVHLIKDNIQFFVPSCRETKNRCKEQWSSTRRAC